MTIRLTQLEQQGGLAKAKIEGVLNEAALQVLFQTLEEYRRRQTRELWLLADGLVALDQHALEQAWPHLPGGLDVIFHTTRFSLQQVLQGCGVKVVLIDPK